MIVGDVAWLAFFAATPVLVVTRFGEQPEIVGWIFAGFGIGAVLGSVIAYRIVASVDRLLLASVGELGMALPLWLFVFHVPPAVLVAAMAVAGLANGLVNAPLHTILQLRTPRHLRTKVYSVVITATAILGPARARGHGPRPRALRRRRDPRGGGRSRYRRGRGVRARRPAVSRLEADSRRRMSTPGVLRDRGVRALVAAEGISSAGSQMTYIVLPWFVLTTTGSPAKTSIVVAAEMAPVAFFGLASGAVTSRLGTRRTFLVADAARAVLLAAIPTLHLLGALSFAALVALVFAVGIFMVPHATAQRVVVPELVGEDEARVGQTMSLLQTALAIAGIVGPALGGVLIALIGETNVLYVDAASYAVAFVLVAVWVRPKPVTHAEDEPTRRDRRRPLPLARPPPARRGCSRSPA